MIDYDYGNGAKQVDDFFEAKRSWSRIKDEIVDKYIDSYLNVVHKLGRNVVVVDAFAGPGRFGDGSDGSPLIICKNLNEKAPHRPVGMSCLFADKRLGHRLALTEHLADYLQRGVCEPPYESCEDVIARAITIGKNATVFFYLDPYGIKDLDFELIRQIRERDLSLSTEILMNFNFRTFMRMSGSWDFDDSADQVEAKVKASKVETVNRVMGGDYWRGIITDRSLDKIDREEAVMQAYVKRIGELFRFAFAVPVKERAANEPGVPSDELAHYHLVFGTRSLRAVQLMNDVARGALDPYFQQFKDGLLFDFTPDRHQAADHAIVKAALVSSVAKAPLKRTELIEAVIPKFFMHYKTKDYRAMVDELVKEGRLFARPDTVKSARLNDNAVLSPRPWS